MLFIDEDIIEDQLNNLKILIETDTLDSDKCNNFIEEYELEDEFSHNEINEIQNLFMREAWKYLSAKFPGKYAMWNDWAVHITTVETYREIMWKDSKHNKDYIATIESRDIIL